MRLHYYHGRVPNFGDDLNPWLWDQLLPGAFNPASSTMLVGIGTLLNEELPPARRTVVFSSGVGYHTQVPTVDASWSIYCVRGPLSAQALGVAPELAVADGALLLSSVYTRQAPKAVRYAFMPHALHASNGWRDVCERLGFGFIDPRRPIPDVLERIGQTDVLITEAMHGAIAADRLGVPWIRARMHYDANPAHDFKWLDWCASVDVPHACHALPPLWQPPAQPGFLARVRRGVKMRHAAAQLRRIARIGRPVLSARPIIARRTEELEKRLAQLRRDLREGRLA